MFKKGDLVRLRSDIIECKSYGVCFENALLKVERVYKCSPRMRVRIIAHQTKLYCIGNAYDVCVEHFRRIELLHNAIE